MMLTYIIMMLCDVVGRLFRGYCKKWAVRLGLFLPWPPRAVFGMERTYVASIVRQAALVLN